MGGLFGGRKSGGDEAAAARARAEADAKAEQDRIARAQAEDEDARRRGLRGRRALLGAGGELGYPNTLGGA